MVEKILKFLREVRAELEKVTWPGRQEVRAATLVIIVLVTLLSIFIGGVDIVIRRLMSLLFRL